MNLVIKLKTMKKLQNNFTTLEQSKRLLEVGIPADSADCYISNKKIFVLHNCTFQENFNEDLDLARHHLIDIPHYIPCWSVGRLIELLCINDIFFDYGGCSYRRGYNIINYIISQLESEDDLDFSELEE